MKKYIKLMRVHHYIKNLLVFAPLACSGQLLEWTKLADGFIAFLAFCMISSAVYIINDIRDKEKDKKHPTKCRRPIASGTVSIKSAYVLLVVLIAFALFLNYLTFSITATVLLLLYFIMNLAYSFGLKNIAIADVAILAAGFFVRILYGAVVTNITISNWLYLTVIVLAFYFALGKRRNELNKFEEGKTRKVLKSYPVSFLEKSMSMCLTLANVFYALWSMDKETIARYGNNYLIITVPLVLLITMKYSLNIEGESDGDHVEVLLHDKVLLALCVIYLAIMFMILYFI